MSELVGNWKNVKDENVSEYLKALGVGAVKRAVIDKIHPDVEITQNGDSWTVRTVSTFSTQENTFTIGSYFETDYKGVISGTMKCMPSFDGKTLKVEATPMDADVSPTTTSREVVSGQMIQTMVCNGVTAKRTYERK